MHLRKTAVDKVIHFQNNDYGFHDPKKEVSYHEPNSGEPVLNTKLVFILTLIGLFVFFIIQNTSVVDIHFLFWTVSMSRALMIFFILAIGIIIGWLLHSHFTHREASHENQ